MLKVVVDPTEADLAEELTTAYYEAVKFEESNNCIV